MIRKCFSLVCGVFLIMAACQPMSPSPTVTLQPTITPQPTLTPQPTITPQPTFTPQPTITSQPILPFAGELKFTEEFSGTSFGFELWRDVKYTDDYVVISGVGLFTSRTSIPEGTAIIFLLKFTLGAFHCQLINKPSYWDANVGVKTDTGRDLFTSVTLKGEFIGGEPLDGELEIKPGQWYFLMIQWLEADIFYIRVWEKENPQAFLQKGLRLGPEWVGYKWYPHINVDRGQVTVDSYQEYETK